jgi:predicted ATPase/class 3 adenylate cyclase/DNA-binding CsgD family transcriptional regulator
MGEGNFVLPTGTVTLVLGDVEGSTRAWESDAQAMTKDLAAINAVIDEAVGRYDGVRPVEQGEGDSFVAAFARARDAVACALVIQKAIADHPLHLRIGVHAGDVLRRDEGNYAGPAVNRAARIRNAAHGGQTVLSQAAAELTADSLPEDCVLVDLGSHRLKDLSRPERIFQLYHPDLNNEFPPLRSLDIRSHNLPVQRTSLVGRGAEMAEVKDLLREASLVTLVGSGGCGKTRLAVQVAAEVLDDYPDGAWLADLAAVSEPGAVATQVASVFALKEGPGMTAADALATYLGQKRALLILDNCEHVLEAVAAVADRLASDCPVLTLLATSRQPLDLPGEIAWRVPSLAVPEPHDLADAGPAGIAGVNEYEAVQLFVDRASRTRPGFALTEANASAVAAICRRLDGIPLAIELAAARIRVFTPAQIAEGLDRRFQLLTGAPRTALPRQQTLEASVDWSYDLLTEVERVVFRRLSVFAGSFDYPAARAVCGLEPIQPHQVLDLLTLLVDKSLVFVDDSGEQARYRLLETVRDYGGTRLAQTEEDAAVHAAHRDHYLAFAEEAEPHLEGPGQSEWIRRVATDYANLRAALTWSRDQDDAEELLRTAAALAFFWFTRGPYEEGVAWLETAATVEVLDLRVYRAKVLFGMSSLAQRDFDYPTITTTAEEGLRLAREIGDDRLVARLTYALGMGQVLAGQSVELLEEGVVLARKVGDPLALSCALLALGIGQMLADPTQARTYLEEAARAAEDYGNHYFACAALGNLGYALWYQGQLHEAKNLLTQVMDGADLVGDPSVLAMSHYYLASVLTELDDPDEARRWIDRLGTVAREAGLRLWDVYQPVAEGWNALAGGDQGAAIDRMRQGVAVAFNGVTRAGTLPFLIEGLLVAGMRDEAEPLMEELIALGETAGWGYWLAWGLLLKARAARLGEDPSSALAVGHEALTAAAAISARGRIVDALEHLAGVAFDLDRPEEAARLFGAAEAQRDLSGYARCVTRRDAEIEALRLAGDHEAFEQAYNEGRALSLDDAVTYARRNRGERKRPAAGWASLTPAEVRVAGLVKDGLSNGEIGRRLMCSPRTVQAHLTHIYNKLGLSSRAELAAETTRH